MSSKQTVYVVWYPDVAPDVYSTPRKAGERLADWVEGIFQGCAEGDLGGFETSLRVYSGATDGHDGFEVHEYSGTRKADYSDLEEWDGEKAIEVYDCTTGEWIAGARPITVDE